MQVTVHARMDDPQPAFQSECFECQPKPIPRTYPVCTIRNTPDKPIHCIVWAKEMLFQRLFGRHAPLICLPVSVQVNNMFCFLLFLILHPLMLDPICGTERLFIVICCFSQAVKSAC